MTPTARPARETAPTREVPDDHQNAALVPIQPAFTAAERRARADSLAGYRGLTREAYALDLQGRAADGPRIRRPGGVPQRAAAVVNAPAGDLLAGP